MVLSFGTVLRDSSVDETLLCLTVAGLFTFEYLEK